MAFENGFAPTVDDVADLIRARTKDSSGNELGTFTDRTRPTDVQVQRHIANGVTAVHQQVGIVGEMCADVARQAAAYWAAAEIELSYFPEQARTDRSPYSYLIARWEEAILGVASCVTGDVAGDIEGAPLVGGKGYSTLRVGSAVVYGRYGRSRVHLPIGEHPEHPIVIPDETQVELPIVLPDETDA